MKVSCDVLGFSERSWGAYESRILLGFSVLEVVAFLD